MSKETIITAISALSAALAEAGLNNVTITVGAPCVTNVTNNVVVEDKAEETRGGRGRRNADADAAKDESASNAKEEAKDDAKSTGRGRGRGAAKEEKADAGTTGRGRGRGAAANKPKPIEDNEAQAETRERLVADLLTLADHDEAIDDVTAALAVSGATNIKAVPSDALDALDDAIGAIFEKYGL